MKRVLLLTNILLLSITTSFGQLATYAGSGGGGLTVTGTSNETVSSLMYSGFGSNTACSSGGLSGITVNTSWSTYSTLGPRVYIKITPNTGYQLNVTGFNAGLRRSGTGPACVRFAYSLDNGSTWTDDFACHAPVNAGCGSTAVSTWSGGSLPTGIVSVTNGIIVALFPYLPSSSSGTFQVNTFNILGNVTVVCTPPVAISGPGSVCAGSSIVLSDASTGGSWSSSSTGIATVGSGSGIVNGVSAGTATITYATGPSCTATATITVNPTPSSIVGAAAICIGATTILSDAMTGGVWTSSNTAVASIGSSSGLISGLAVGTSTIVYTVATGCSVSETFTVNPLPASISGSRAVCQGQSTLLSDAGGGTWTSSNTGVATIGIITGLVNGIAPGTATITYSVGVGCTAFATVTVNALPSTITGPTAICLGSSGTLVDLTTGGIWSSSNTSVATVGTGGVISGILVGTTTISYTLSTGCAVVTTVTINPLPSAITGVPVVCVGYTTTLSDAGGGTWSSSNTVIARVGLASGIVTGVSPGTAFITYTLPTGCVASISATINPIPSVIVGTSYVCVGSTTALSDAGGGTWSSSNSSVATVGSGTGIVSGIAAGTSNITYTISTGCFIITTVTVNPLPSAITGVTYVCTGSSTALSDIGGGTWTSSNTFIATVGPASGIVNGVGAGSATITYTLGTGCITTVIITVNSLPGPIVGVGSVCVGATSALTDAGGGTWTSSNTAVASVGFTTGVVTGISTGTAVITYTIASGCYVTTTVTVNPNPSPIIASGYVCVGATALLGGFGGTWTSSNLSIATIGSTSGIVSGLVVGTSTITFAFTTGCFVTLTETVYPLPSAITGITSVCTGSSTTLSDGGIGVWSSSNTAVATIGFTNGIVNSVSAGTALITYMLATGCKAFTTVTVNPLPTPIIGVFNVCEGATTILSDTSAGGAWTSSDITVATIGLTTGMVTGVLSGTSLITYAFPTGCLVTAVMTVNPSPAAIAGIPSVCAGSTTVLSDVVTGGTWTSSNTFVAAVPSGIGVVTGMAAGTATITYSLGAGCIVTSDVTVNPVAPITGVTTICVGFTTPLSDAVGGGTWSSSNPSVATIGLTTGMLSGRTIGTSIITYTSPAGCTVFTLATISSLPPAITGDDSVCVGASTFLSDARGGGAWFSSKPGIATVGLGSGLVTGLLPGTSLITYTLGFGCTVAKTVTINPLPAAITGNTRICLGSSFVLSDASLGGLWTSINSTLATVGSASGGVSGIAVGTAGIVYTLPTGCNISVPVVIEVLPTIYPVTGGGHFCSADSGVHIAMVGSALGTSYLLYRSGTFATGPLLGSGGTLDFGLQTLGGSYTVIATNTVTGCKKDMGVRIAVVVDTSVVPAVNISTGVGDTICAGVLTTYTAAGINEGLTPGYQWAVNGTNVGFGSAYSFVPADGDVVSCILTSSARCAKPLVTTNSVKMTVTVPQMPVATISPDTACQGYAVTLTPAALYGGYTPAFEWFVNTHKAGTGNTFTYIPSEADVVYCRMTSDFPCRLTDVVSSNSVKIKVDSPLIPHVVVTANPGTNIGIGWSDTLTARVTNGGTSPTYQWVINGLPVTGATTNTFISSNFSHPKYDSVSCEVTSSGICTMTSFGWSYITVSDVGIKPLSPESTITVVPNPNKGAFTVKGDLGKADQECSLQMTDMLGQIVYNSMLVASNGRVDQEVTLSDAIANGMYLLNVRSESGNHVFHIVIEK